MIYFQLVSLDVLIYSNIPNNISILDVTNVSAETIICPNTVKKRRQIFIKEKNYSMVIISFDEEMTNKIFRHYINAYKSVVPYLLNSYSEISKREIQNTRRLKHNIINHSSRLQMELYKLIPQDSIIKGKHNQIEHIKETILNDPILSANTFLKILKNVNFIKAEFDVFDMLNSKDPFLDFAEHSIYKVIHLAITPFWLDFLEKNITVVIGNSTKNLLFDYKSLSVALCHIFDNSVKYCAPHSSFEISFFETEQSYNVTFNMISLKIEDSEVDKIFSDEYSGIWSKRLSLAGNGIGMATIKRLLELNNTSITLNKNINTNKNKLLNGIPYENNLITVHFNVY